MKLKVELDFNAAKRAATKAGDDIKEAFDASMKASLGNKAFWGAALRQNASTIEKFQRDMVRKQKDLQTRELVRQHNAERKSASELSKHRTQLIEKEAALARERDEDRKQALQEEIDETKNLVKLYEEVEQSSERFNANTQSIVRGLLSSARSTEKFAKRMEAAADAAKDIQDALDGLSLENLGENLTGVAEDFGDALKNGIDLEGLSKSLGKGIGKYIGKGIQSLGGGGAVTTALAGGLAAAVAALGIFAALMLATDKKVKEFNKDIIKTHGALSVMRLGAGNLTKGLNILRHTTMDLQGNFGVTEEQAKELFSTLDEGGYTLSRITGGTQNAAEAQYRLTSAIRETQSVASLMGVSLSTYAQNLTEYVDNLGMSTQSVNDNFLQIAQTASDSAFSTRRFYSIVTQATSGQSALNVSMAQTGDLLMRMSKIMGMKKAAEMVGGATSDLAGMSATDRIKANILAGREGKHVFEREAHSQSLAFGQSRGAQAAGVVKEMGPEFQGLSEAIRNSATDPDELAKRLGALNSQQQQQLISGIRASGATPEEQATNAETARQLDALIQVTRGAQGSRSDRVAAMGQISAGGSLAFRAAQMGRFINMRSSTMSETDRAAAESVSGMSGPAMDTFLDAIRANSADFDTMIRLAEKSNRTEVEEQQLKNLTKTHHVHVENGKILDESRRQIHNGNELLQTTHEATAAEQAKLRSEAESVAQETMDATLSIADILENKLGKILQDMYDYFKGPFDTAINLVLDLLDQIPGVGTDRERQNRERLIRTGATADIDKKIAQLSDTKTRRQEMARLRVTANNKDITKEQRDAAKTQLERLTQEEASSRSQIDELSRIRASIESGNTYYTREVGSQSGSGRARMEELTGRGPTRAMTPDMVSQALGIPPTNMSGGPGILDLTNPNDPATQRILGHLSTSHAPATTPGGTTPTPAATPTPTPAPTPAAPIPPLAPAAATAMRAAAGVSPAAPTPTPTPAQQARDPGAMATADASEEQRTRDERDRRERRNHERQQQRNADRLLKGKDFGDGLATSRLPDAIAEADAKMRLTEALFKEGKSADDITRILEGRNISPTDEAGTDSGNLVKALGLRRAQLQQAQQDFIYQSRGDRAMVTPISSQDSVVGAKPGGALANLAGRAGGGGNVNIHINGGDERRVFDVVKRAIQQAGITPNRVPAGGT